jgi:hypothetical protein
MLVGARAHWLPKAGNAQDEYEDAFWPVERAGPARRFRCAVADGATETSFSGLWARLLVQAYGRGHLGALRWETGLEALRCRWRSAVGQKPLPWYAEEKLRQGAYAAFLGLTLSLRSDGSVRWSALAVGDCCLFQIREDRLIASFPLGSSGEFNSRPYLVGSVRPTDVEEAEAARRSGPALPGDRFLLMSDALAAWFLRAAEDGCSPWGELEEAAADTFPDWVAARRSAGAMRNDDVTLLTITFAGTEP